MDLVFLILIMASMCSTDGKKSAKLPRRLDVLEYKMTSLELRVIGDASKINDLSDMVEYMNLTFHDHEAVCRNTVASRTTKTQVSNTDYVKNIADIGDRVIAAFQQEKIKLRETVNTVNTTLVELRENSSKKTEVDFEAIIDDYNELKNAIENINISLIEKQDEITSTLEALASELKQDRMFNSKTITLISEELKSNFNKQIKAMESIIDNKYGRLLECPELWSEYKSFCYLYVNTQVNYKEAQRLCAVSGAYVVDINSQAEMDFLNGLTGKGKYWIGLTDSEKEGTWKWDKTNSEASFTNWNPGQPNNWRSREHCASVGYLPPLKKWYDKYCIEEYNYVCKKSL